MAVSQVDRLKNPCRVTTWNNFVASQPPSSAPAMPITQVMTRPCDLLPGISRLASRPAPRPRTIHAMTPITGLLCCDELMAGLVPDRGRGDWPRRGFAIPCRLTCHLSVKPGTPAAERTGIRKRHHTGRLLAIRADSYRLGADDPRQRLSCGKAVTTPVRHLIFDL